MKITLAQAQRLLDMQEATNSAVNPDWRKKAWPFHRAILMEATELIEHLDWKWWKRQANNLDQAKLELVDILHFALSLSLLHQRNAGDLVVSLASCFEMDKSVHIGGDAYKLHTLDMVRSAEIMAGKAASREFSYALFGHMCRLADLSGDELYKLYIGKAALNRFRQDNGYKEGTYIKEWHGQEDNAYLAEVLTQLPADEGLFNNVTLALAVAYEHVTASGA